MTRDGQAATDAERAGIELDLNVVSDDDEAEIKHEEAAPCPTREEVGSARVVNLFGMKILITDDSEEESREDREDDEDGDKEHGEEPEAEGERKEEVEDEGEDTEVYHYTDEEEKGDKEGGDEEERQAEGVKAELERARKGRRKQREKQRR